LQVIRQNTRWNCAFAEPPTVPPVSRPAGPDRPGPGQGRERHAARVERHTRRTARARGTLPILGIIRNICGLTINLTNSIQKESFVSYSSN